MYTTQLANVQPLQISQSIHGPIMLMQATTQEQRVSDSHLIVTLNTPHEAMDSPPGLSIDIDDDSSVTTALSSCSDNDPNDSSSDWDSDSPPVAGDGDMINPNHERSMSIASSYLPRFHKKTNHHQTLATFSMNMSLADVSTVLLEDERGAHHSKHNTEFLYQDALFYPHPNLQSLLFSHIHPFTENDYRTLDIGGGCDEGDDIGANEQSMDWYDIQSVNKFKKMLSQLLITASFGIREDELYLMFSSPSPSGIIMHLRFGLLSHLCDTNIDRFGRRSFYYHYPNTKDIQTPHFFQHSKLPSELDDLVFGDSHLSSFIEETPTSDGCASPIVSYSPVTQPTHVSWKSHTSHSFKPYKIKSYEPLCDSPIHNEDYSPIPLATSITLKEHIVPKVNRFAFPIKIQTDLEDISLEPISHPSIRFSNAYLQATNTKTQKVTQLPPVPHTLTDRLHSGIKDRNSHLFGTNTPPAIMIKTDPLPQRISTSRTDKTKSRKAPPNRPLPFKPKPAQKPQVLAETRRKLSDRKMKMMMKKRAVSVKEFKSVNLLDVLPSRESNRNYEMAKCIAKHFDVMFGDTDTVCIVSGADKEPDLSYWLKGDFIRKTQNVGMDNKTICVYRACRHMKAKQPIVSQAQFEQFVRNLCVQDKNKSVKDIGDILDDKFGYGVHFARSTLKRCDYDIYCRYSDKYECSFTLPSGAYIVAWRR
eukprot:568005_1